MGIWDDKKRALKLNQNGFAFLLFAAVLAFFLLAGREGAVLFDDSGSYLRLRWHEGVMPFYPMFILLNQFIFGSDIYLWVVIVEQALLAAFSIVLMEETIRRWMGLHFAEGILICILALYPYTIEMPTAVMTQVILTEGIAYSLFYIFFTVLLKAVWNKSYGGLIGAFCMAALLSAVRSQLQILFGVCGIIFFYLICMRGKRGAKKERILRFLAGIAGCVAVSLLGIALTVGIVRIYKPMVLYFAEDSLSMFAMRVQDPEGYQETLEEIREREREDAEQAETGKQYPEDEQEEEDLTARIFSTSQYLTLLFSRGMYEADREDAALFEDEVIRGLYLALYDVVDAEQERYAYAQEGLWMWRDIMGGLGKIGGSCLMTPSEYYAEYAPEVIRAENFSDIRHRHLQTIGLTLIIAHFGRFLYHTLMLLPQAFISTVFFQYAPLYLFCHLVTAFLYLSAAALMIWGYAEERARKEGAEMMALVLGTNVVMVVIISLIFFGQQRYLVYAFGPFYIAYYLLLRQLWCVRIREFVRRRFR